VMMCRYEFTDTHSFPTAFMDLNLYRTKWALSFVLVSFLYFLPARRYASAGNSDRNVSVHPSVTRRYCVKTKKASGMISSPSGSPKTLVFCCQISSPNSKGFPPNGGIKQGSIGKFSDFLALSVNISKTVADTAKVTISH